MGKLWIGLLLTTLLLFFVPILLHKAPETVNEPIESGVEACQVEITVIGLDEPVPLEEYVKGVVSAEMPVTFHEEALKAQAIAARTYALRLTEFGKNANRGRRFSASVFLRGETKRTLGKRVQKQ